jgi:hypothetical protein
VAGAVLGLVIWQEPRRLPESAAASVSSRPATHGVPGKLDRSTREASIGDASMTLPDDPYVVRADPMHAAGLFDSYFVASATVHEDYHAHSDWSAMVGLGGVSRDVDQADLDGTARAVAETMAAVFFDGQPTTVKKVSVADHSVDGRPGVHLTAEVRYDITGLPSRADELTVVVIRLDDGTVVAAFSSVPVDAPSGVREQAAEALGSLQAG